MRPEPVHSTQRALGRVAGANTKERRCRSILVLRCVPSPSYSVASQVGRRERNLTSRYCQERHHRSAHTIAPQLSRMSTPTCSIRCTLPSTVRTSTHIHLRHPLPLAPPLGHQANHPHRHRPRRRRQAHRHRHRHRLHRRRRRLRHRFLPRLRASSLTTAWSYCSL